MRALKGVPGEWRLFAVTQVPEDAVSTLPSRWPCSLRRHPALVGAASILALALLATILTTRRDDGVALNPEEVLAAGAEPGIAVLPFKVNDPALETWEEGMIDLLSINLDGVPSRRFPRRNDPRDLLPGFRTAALLLALPS